MSAKTKRLKRERDEWREAYDRALENKMRWQRAYYRLKGACEGSIADTSQELHDHIEGAVKL